MQEKVKQVKYLILGAGPAGLTLAHRLRQKGEESFLVLEKEEEAGGLCRSRIVEGSPLDIGGGHFLDVRRPGVVEFLFQFMPREEWNLFERDSRIQLQGAVVSHPLEANIWQLPLEWQVEYLSSIAKAGCNSGVPMPDKFVNWITWKLGEKIANDYMLPYNRKMFADELNELGIYWLEKLPDVSFEDTLRSCLLHKAYGSQPGHASFYYPKNYGYGELWLRMARELSQKVLYRCRVSSLDCENRMAATADGECFQAEKIITTIPWSCFEEIKGMPREYVSALSRLKSSGIEVRFCREKLDSSAHWIYEPAENVPYHRILVRHNFCPGSCGYWVETRQERTEMFGAKDSSFRYLNSYAYPLNTVEKPLIMENVLRYAKAKGIYGLGRWGEHSHYNSDLVVERAMNLADAL